MSLKQTGELIKSILNNVKISWIGMAIKGLTYKAFGMDYNSTKEHLFEYLKELTEQIKYMIF